jgi:hypothetical protein
MIQEKNDDNAAEYNIFSDMIVNHSMKKDNDDAIEYNLFSDMSEWDLQFN